MIKLLGRGGQLIKGKRKVKKEEEEGTGSKKRKQELIEETFTENKVIDGHSNNGGICDR